MLHIPAGFVAVTDNPALLILELTTTSGALVTCPHWEHFPCCP